MTSAVAIDSVGVGGNAGAIAGVAIRGAEVVVKGNIGSRAGQVMKARAEFEETLMSQIDDLEDLRVGQLLAESSSARVVSKTVAWTGWQFDSIQARRE